MFNGNIKEISRREARPPSPVAMQCEGFYADLTGFVCKLYQSTVCCQKEINIRRQKVCLWISVPDTSAHHRVMLLVFSLYPGSASWLVDQALCFTMQGSKESEEGAGPQYPLRAYPKCPENLLPDPTSLYLHHH